MDEVPTLGHYLAQAGYDVVLKGEWGLSEVQAFQEHPLLDLLGVERDSGDDLHPFGFQGWEAHRDGDWYRRSLQTTSEAVEYVRRRQSVLSSQSLRGSHPPPWALVVSYGDLTPDLVEPAPVVCEQLVKHHSWNGLESDYGWMNGDEDEDGVWRSYDYDDDDDGYGFGYGYDFELQTEFGFDSTPSNDQRNSMNRGRMRKEGVVGNTNQANQTNQVNRGEEQRMMNGKGGLKGSLSFNDMHALPVIKGQAWRGYPQPAENMTDHHQHHQYQQPYQNTCSGDKVSEMALHSNNSTSLHTDTDTDSVRKSTSTKAEEDGKETNGRKRTPLPSVQRRFSDHCEQIGHQRICDEYTLRANQLDQMLGELLQEVFRSDVGDTIIIVTSVNGNCEGEHGMWGSCYNAYEPSIHVPCLVYVPSQYTSLQRALYAQSHAMTSSVDLLPSLLQMTHVDVERLEKALMITHKKVPRLVGKQWYVKPRETGKENKKENKKEKDNGEEKKAGMKSSISQCIYYQSEDIAMPISRITSYHSLPTSSSKTKRNANRNKDDEDDKKKKKYGETNNVVRKNKKEDGKEDGNYEDIPEEEIVLKRSVAAVLVRMSIPTTPTTAKNSENVSEKERWLKLCYYSSDPRSCMTIQPISTARNNRASTATENPRVQEKQDLAVCEWECYDIGVDPEEVSSCSYV